MAEGEFDRLVAAYDGAPGDPIERIRYHGKAYVAYAHENPELFQVMFLFPPELSLADVPDDVMLPAATRAFASAADTVDDAIAAGAIHTDDPLLATLTLWAAVHGVASVLQLGFGLPTDLEDAMVDEVTNRILAGYGS